MTIDPVLRARLRVALIHLGGSALIAARKAFVPAENCPRFGP